MSACWVEERDSLLEAWKLCPRHQPLRVEERRRGWKRDGEGWKGTVGRKESWEARRSEDEVGGSRRNNAGD
eukprot:767276-Hanusia_phi.AAC.2